MLVSNLVSNKKNLAIILWLGLFLIMALRAPTVGNDLERYIEQFSSAQYFDVGDSRTEAGYVVFLKILHFFGLGKRGFIVVVSFIVSGSFSWFFYKFSKNLAFTFLMHVLVGLFAFSLTGIRQSLAVSLTLFAFYFAVRNQIIYFIGIVILAFTFHSSALIFMPIYFLVKYKLNNYKKIFLVICIGFFLAFANQYLVSSLGFLSTEKYSNSYLENSKASGLNILPIIFQFCLVFSVVIIWQIKNIKLMNIDANDLIFTFLSFLSVIFVMMAINLSIISRFSFYFTPYICVLIPNSIEYFDRKDTKRILQILVCLIGSLFFYMANSNGVLKIDNYEFDNDIF